METARTAQFRNGAVGGGHIAESARLASHRYPPPRYDLSWSYTTHPRAIALLSAQRRPASSGPWHAWAWGR